MVRFDFTVRVALVTGGTSGIGLATARDLARVGAAVALLARGVEAGQATAAAIEHEGARALFLPADVADEVAVARAVEGAMKHFGRLDYAVNCAGAGGDMAALEKASQPVWDSVLAINARGAWLATRYEIPAMLASGGGAIVNMSSIYGLAGKAAHHAYVASKHAWWG